MEDQIMDWLYEHGIKHEFNNLCNRDKTSSRSSHLSILMLTFVGPNGSWNQLVDDEELQPDSVQRHLTYSSWDDVKQRLNYQDDKYKFDHAELLIIALCAVEQRDSPKHLNQGIHDDAEEFLRSQLPWVKDMLMRELPPTALHKLINAKDLQEMLPIPDIVDFKILLSNFGNNVPVSESDLIKIVETLVIDKSKYLGQLVQVDDVKEGSTTGNANGNKEENSHKDSVMAEPKLKTRGKNRATSQLLDKVSVPSQKRNISPAHTSKKDSRDLDCEEISEAAVDSQRCKDGQTGHLDRSHPFNSETSLFILKPGQSQSFTYKPQEPNTSQSLDLSQNIDSESSSSENCLETAVLLSPDFETCECRESRLQNFITATECNSDEDTPRLYLSCSSPELQLIPKPQDNLPKKTHNKKFEDKIESLCQGNTEEKSGNNVVSKKPPQQAVSSQKTEIIEITSSDSSLRYSPNVNNESSSPTSTIILSTTQDIISTTDKSKKTSARRSSKHKRLRSTRIKEAVNESHSSKSSLSSGQDEIPGRKRTRAVLKSFEEQIKKKRARLSCDYDDFASSTKSRVKAQGKKQKSTGKRRSIRLQKMNVSEEDLESVLSSKLSTIKVSSSNSDEDEAFFTPLNSPEPR
ncbi:hypothetical protein Hamer_G017081 [Homarus americanus]|uniref:Uncharacterized protein n=1 Tax=Homarus americanus TaxID=6706 RepID=A0A8J5JYX1_HOMAM|nr:hypothetical protein Hamer_G017081 [Homarus americanus]